MAKTFLDLQNIRATKLNEATASKILDVDLARMYNEIISEMSHYAQNIKKVTTNIVANQEEYTQTVIPGLIATADVKINGTYAQFVTIDQFSYASDLNRPCHTVLNGSILIAPKPTASATNGLDVLYWAKYPEIIDAAVAGTALTELNDRDWAIVAAGILAKAYEKLCIYYTTTSEAMPDANIETLFKLSKIFNENYQAKLEELTSIAQMQHKPARRSAAAQENKNTNAGIGRQDK